MAFNINKNLDNPVVLQFTGGINPEGAYNAGTTYVTGDSVSYNGSSYVAIQESTGNLPTNTTYWQVLANKGDTGTKGDTGDTGATGPKGDTGNAGANGADGVAATIAVGTVTSGATPSITNSGTESAAVFDFVLAKGDTGDTGPQGIQGIQGVQGETGATGAKGDKGDTGVGIAAGGTTDQVLAKNSNTDYDTKWVDPTAGTGDVVGPANATDDNIATFDTTTGKLIQDSGVALADLQKKTVITVGTEDADYITDGTDDHIQIQAAVDAVPTAGGTVLLKAGTYTIADSIDLKARVTFKGEGHATQITNAGTTPMIVFPDVPASPATPLYITVENIRFWGGGLAYAAIDCGDYGQEFIIRNCWFHKFGTNSSCITTTTNKKFHIIGNFFGGSAFDDAGQNGIYIGLNLSATGDVEIVGNNFHQYHTAISGNTEKTQITGNNIYSSAATYAPDTICINLGTAEGGLQIANITGNTFSDTDVGVKCNQAAGVGGLNIVGNFFRNINGNAVYLRGMYHVVTDNYFQDVAKTLTGDNTNGVLLADGAKYIKIAHNNIYNSHTNMTYGINISDVAGGFNVVADNTITGGQTGDIREGTSPANIIRKESEIKLDGEAAHTFSVGRNSTTAGSSLTIQAGGAVSGGTDIAAGDLILKSGIATGAGSQGNIRFYTTAAGSAGTTDRNPAIAASLFGNGRLYLGNDVSPSGTGDLSFKGNVAKVLSVIRNGTADTAGVNLTVQSGGATSGATDKGAGSLILSSGVSTGTGTSTVLIKTADVGTTGTSDNALTQRAQFDNNGLTVNNKILVNNALAGNALSLVPSVDGSSSTSSGGQLFVNNTLSQRVAVNVYTKHANTTDDLVRIRYDAAHNTKVNGSQTVDSTTSSLTVTSTTGWPSSGKFIVYNGTSESTDVATLVFTYTATDSTHFTGDAGTFYPGKSTVLVDQAVIRELNQTHGKPLLRVTDTSTPGGASNILIEGPTPDIEIVSAAGYDQSIGEGKFELDIPQGNNSSTPYDCLRINGRKDDNSGFLPVSIFRRPGVAEQGMVGIGFQNGTTPTAIAAHLHVLNTTTLGDTNAAALIGQIIQAASGQTANLLQIRNSDGDVLAFIDKDGKVSVPDEAYGVSWNGSTEVPTKNAVYDKIESLSTGISEGLAIAYSIAL